MKKNISGTIRTVAEFLGKSLTEKQVENMEKIKKHTRFQSTKSNVSVCPAPMAPRESFFRKGEVGDWKNYFSQSQSEYVGKLVNERLVPLGLEIKME